MGRLFCIMENPFTVYVLHSEAFNKIYIGFTSNLKERLKSHNVLATKGYTAKYRPWTIVHTETFEQKKNALRREKELKSYQGRKFIRNNLLKDI